MFLELISEYSSKFSIYVLIFSVLLLWVWKKFSQKNLLGKIVPGTKLALYEFAGHVSYIPRGPVYASLHDLNTYYLQTLMGFRQLHLNDSMFVFWVFNIPFVFLQKADAVEALYSSTTLLEKSRSYKIFHSWLRTGLFTSSGAKWKSRRKLLTPTFHFDILKDFLPIINKKAQVLVQILKESIYKEWIDTIKIMMLCSLDIICETALGVETTIQREENSEYVTALLRVSDSIVERILTVFQRSDTIYFKTKAGQQFQKDIDTLHRFTQKAIRKKKSLLQGKTEETGYNDVCRKRKAFMDLLLDYHMKHEDFTEENIQEEVDTFTFAGNDTSAIALSWTLYLLGLYSEIQEKVQEELDHILENGFCEITSSQLSDMKYLECVIKESLRLYSPVPLNSRAVVEDINFCGYHIPKGAELIIFAHALHRDADVFPNPEDFDPDRFLPENSNGRHPYAYVPFAAGPRNCIGQRFAMMEIKAILANVLKHFSVKSLDARDKVIPSAKLTLHPSHPIRLKITPRHVVPT